MSALFNMVVSEGSADELNHGPWKKANGSIGMCVPIAEGAIASKQNAYAYPLEFLREHEEIAQKYCVSLDCTTMLNGVTQNANGCPFKTLQREDGCFLILSKKKEEDEKEIINDIFLHRAMFGASLGCLSNHFSRTFSEEPDNTLVIESFFPTGKNACLLKCVLSDDEFSEAWKVLNDKEKKEVEEFVGSASGNLQEELQKKCREAYMGDIYAKMSGPDALKAGRKLPGGLFLKAWNKYRLVHYVNGLMCAALHDPRVLFIITSGKVLIEANKFGDGTWARFLELKVESGKDVQRLKNIANHEKELVMKDVEKCLENPAYMLEIALRPAFTGEAEDATYATMVTFGYMFCNSVYKRFGNKNLRQGLNKLTTEAFVQTSYVDVFMDFFSEKYFERRHLEQCRTLHESTEEVTKKAKY